MKNIKLYIAILSIFLVILIGAIVIINYTQKRIEEQEEEKQVGDVSEDLATEIQKLNNHTTYNSIEKMFENLYMYGRVQNKTAVYSLIDEIYIQKNDIEMENVISRLSLNDKKKNQLKVKEIYEMQDLSYPTYFVKIYNRENINEKWYYILYMDNQQGAFSLEPISENEYNSYVHGNELFEIKEKIIEKNDYNKILRKSLSENEIAKKYFDDYIENALYNVEESYNSIEEEYRQKKFGNIEEYKRYLNSKKEQLISMGETTIKIREDFQTEDAYREYINSLKGLEKYRVIRNEDNTQYICIDEYGNYYLFNLIASFEYTVILDNYTVDVPDFIEEYNTSEENKKVKLNIQKLIIATKQGDYKYVYSKLADSFKSTNFPTQASFEKYIKEKYNKEDKIGFTKYEKIDNVHIYDIEVTKENGNKITAQIVMQLKEGTDFVMSFSASE